MHRFVVFCLVVACALPAACGDAGDVDAGRASSADDVRVAVAANFADAFDEIAADFALVRPDVRVTASVGSTGALAAQIASGAPFDVLLAADVERPAQLQERCLVVPGTRFTYARGRLALVGALLADVPDGERALRDERVRHVAVANPSTAPYGAAALEVLRTLGLADTLAAKLVLGNDVGQTMQFVESGAAELGFCALAQLARHDEIPRWLVPAALHAPIRQDAALLRDGEPARALLDFLRGPQAALVLQRHGYGVEE
ncbi:MAG: molybdate ABC transporter substrate-binding protein [Planctomycetes bacterium]|nr:molybdate ABC transporter substrate-binding protein [Planctomycetota bacterium]